MSMEKFLNGDRVYELWAKIKSALSAKQNVLTAGDGITIEDDAIRVTTPVRGLTQAEYDGIPEEERKGLYIVTDANTALPEGGRSTPPWRPALEPGLTASQSTGE